MSTTWSAPQGWLPHGCSAQLVQMVAEGQSEELVLSPAPLQQL